MEAIEASFKAMEGDKSLVRPYLRYLYSKPLSSKKHLDSPMPQVGAQLQDAGKL